MLDAVNIRLSDISFINDSSQDIILHPTINGKDIENLKNYIIKWGLSLYGDTTPIIIKSTKNTNEITIQDNEIIVHLNNDDTAGLPNGTYEQQFSMTIGNVKLRPCFGVINIKNGIKEI